MQLITLYPHQYPTIFSFQAFNNGAFKHIIHIREASYEGRRFIWMALPLAALDFFFNSIDKRRTLRLHIRDQPSELDQFPWPATAQSELNRYLDRKWRKQMEAWVETKYITLSP